MKRKSPARARKHPARTKPTARRSAPVLGRSDLEEEPSRVISTVLNHAALLRPGRPHSEISSRRAKVFTESNSETFEDCPVTVQGDKVWMSGRLADELAEAARQASMTFQEAFNYCIRIRLPMVLAEHEANRSGRKGKKKLENSGIARGSKS